jgi:hypothetical protein
MTSRSGEPVGSSGHTVNPDGSARVWASIEVKLNMGDYESVTFSLGASHDCANSAVAIKRAQRRLMDQNEELAAARVAPLRGGSITN